MRIARKTIKHVFIVFVLLVVFASCSQDIVVWDHQYRGEYGAVCQVLNSCMNSNSYTGLSKSEREEKILEIIKSLSDRGTKALPYTLIDKDSILEGANSITFLTTDGFLTTVTFGENSNEDAIASEIYTSDSNRKIEVSAELPVLFVFDQDTHQEKKAEIKEYVLVESIRSNIEEKINAEDFLRRSLDEREKEIVTWCTTQSDSIASDSIDLNDHVLTFESLNGYFFKLKFNDESTEFFMPLTIDIWSK